MKRLGTLALFVLLVTAAEASRARLDVPERCISDLRFGRCETRADGRTYCPETSFRAQCFEVKK